jgi:transposase InsO family protein
MRKNRDKVIREKVELFYLAARLQNVREACARRGVSRDYYYRWWARLKRFRYKIEGLKPKSRAPKHSPKKIDRLLESRIRYLRKVHGEGALILTYRLKREGYRVEKSTVQYVLNRRKRLKKLKKPKLKVHRRRYELPVPGQRVQLDVKHAGRLITGQKVYVFNAIDECTRWKYAKAFLNYTAQTTVEFLSEMKKQFPFPIQCIQTDNGTEFTNRLVSTLVGGEPKKLHPMEAWCKKNNIRQRLIPVGEKELNGKVERSHRMDDEYYYYRASRSTIDNFNRGLGIWTQNYLFKRPHGGLKGKTPFEKWEERLIYLPFEKVELRWEKVKQRFLKELSPHQNPGLQLLEKLQRELNFYNDHFASGILP